MAIFGKKKKKGFFGNETYLVKFPIRPICKVLEFFFFFNNLFSFGYHVFDLPLPSLEE